MPHFEHQRVSGEPALQIEEVLPGLGRVPERDRKLQQERAQAIRLHDRVDPGPELAFVGRGRVPLVREAAPQLGGVAERLLPVTRFAQVLADSAEGGR